MHDQLVEGLAPRSGDRWLDLATGTGGVALRAARAGADVTGLDLAPALLAQARDKADRRGLRIRWDEGDAGQLPYADASFDIVSSCFGIIFVPDRAAVSAEITRVCRPGGRLGLANWRPNEGLHRIYARFATEDSAQPVEEWGQEERVEEYLGASFDLRFEERVWHLEGDSPESVWELMTSSAPPVKAFVESLEPERLEEFRHAMLEHWAKFGTDGRVSEPRRYIVVTGIRRA